MGDKKLGTEWLKTALSALASLEDNDWILAGDYSASGEPKRVLMSVLRAAIFSLSAGDGPTFNHLHLTGGQIAFPASQNASADPNTIDDYEEGAWTPTLTCGTSGTITLTANKGGKYVKNGSLVLATAYIPVDSVSSPVGQLRIGGLPYTNGDSYGNACAGNISGWTFAAAATTQIMARLPWAGTFAVLEKFAAGTTSDLAADVQAGTSMYFGIVYAVTF